MKLIQIIKDQLFKKVTVKEVTTVTENESLVGKIFYTSWGYEQTNVDFVQIIKESDKSIWYREIKSKQVEGGDMSGQVIGLKDEFISENVFISRKQVQSNNETWFSSTFGGSYKKYFNMWTGKPVYTSSYY